MKNKIVGYVIIGISLLIGFVIFSFNRALTQIANMSCNHGMNCPMLGTISFQTNIGIGIMAFVVLIGVYLIFFGKEEKIITKTVKEQIVTKDITKENYKEIMDTLGEDEKQILEKIIEAKGTIFQSTIVDETGLSKVKVTRILDRLEGRNIIERKRRGMTNVVILKHN